MSDEKTVIPYKVAKGNRPKIEEVITYCLDGDMQKAALDFAEWMRENKMPLKIGSSSTRNQGAVYKGEQICTVIVYGEDDWKHVGQRNPGDSLYWTVTPKLNYMDRYEDAAVSEGLENILWDNVNICQNHSGNKMGCSPDKKCAGGRDLTILGKVFHGVTWCYPHSIIKNPDEAAIKAIKKLLELEQEARNTKS